MRTFLGILLGVMGIAALVLAVFGFGTTNMFWLVAYIIAAAVLIVSAVVMFRSRAVDDVDVAVYKDDDYPTLRG